MQELNLFVKEETLKTVEEVLDNIGLDVQTAVRMFLKKIENEKSIGFLVADTTQKDNAPSNVGQGGVYMPKNETALTKVLAKRMFEDAGHKLYDEVRFSRRNKATKNYWQNFEVDLFNEPLSIILNDQENRVAYLFNIPANSIDVSKVVVRADAVNMVDLQIRAEDSTFTDTKSGIKFSDYLVVTINY